MATNRLQIDECVSLPETLFTLNTSWWVWFRPQMKMVFPGVYLSLFAAIPYKGVGTFPALLGQQPIHGIKLYKSLILRKTDRQMHSSKIVTDHARQSFNLAV